MLPRVAYILDPLGWIVVSDSYLNSPRSFISTPAQSRGYETATSVMKTWVFSRPEKPKTTTTIKLPLELGQPGVKSHRSSKLYVRVS